MIIEMKFRSKRRSGLGDENYVAVRIEAVKSGMALNLQQKVREEMEAYKDLEMEEF